MNALPMPVIDEIDALADRIAETAALLDAGTHRLLTDVRRFDEHKGWHRQGALSCAHWLNWRCGIALGAAREKVRVAHALASLPVVDEALRRGEVSYSKVRAMTRVATPTNEAALLDFARSSTASQLEKLCRKFVLTQPTVPPESSHWLRVRGTDDGWVRLEAQLSAEEAALVLRALDVSAEKRGRAEGLVAMAEAALRGDAPARPPVEITVHVEASTLRGELEDGRGVSAETCRRLLCDAGVVPVVEDDRGTPLDVGRKTRTVPAALRRALQRRDGGCRFPGCTNRLVDAHHVVHWIDGGETKLSNLTLCCRRHHVLVHEAGFRVELREDGRAVFFSPDGSELPGAGIPPGVGSPAASALRQHLGEGGQTIGPMNACPRWDGELADYGAAVDTLCREGGGP